MKIKHLFVFAVIWFTLFSMSRCDEESIPAEIKAEITDISNQDEAKDSSLASLDSLDNKAFFNLGNLFNRTSTTTRPTPIRRPYPLYLNNPINPPNIAQVTPFSTIVNEIAETLRFAVTIPPARNNRLAENNFRIPFRSSNPIELELGVGRVQPITTPPRLPALNSGNGFIKEGDDQPIE